MAGMWPLSYQQQHDLNGKPYPGSRAYFYDAETGDPIAVYQTYSAASAAGSTGRLPNPVTADAWGRFPGVFISGDYLFYRHRVETSAGSVLIEDSTIPNVGPAESGGGDPVEPVEASAVAKTGDVKARLGTGLHDGWLILAGQTMGSVSSGANSAQDANEALFKHLWDFDEIEVVSGKGATAQADWDADKQLTLPNASGRTLAGLDNMSGSAASVLTGFDDIGQILGTATKTLDDSEIPPLSGTTSSNGAHTHTIPYQAYAFWQAGGGSPGVTSGSTITTSSSGAHTHTVTVNSGVTPAAFSLAQPTLGVSLYVKL